MNRYLACFAVTVLLCSLTCISAQNNSTQTKPKEAPESQKINVKTELMEVRTVVTDSKGRIIENLKKEDFELLENDQQQQISFFSVSKIESETSRPPAAKAAVPDGAAKTPRGLERINEPPVRTTLLYVDNLHLSFSSLNAVKQSLRRFINEQLTDQDMVALATSSGTLGIAQQFTRNRQLLRYGVEQIRPGPLQYESIFTPSLAARVIIEGADSRSTYVHYEEVRAPDGSMVNQRMQDDSPIQGDAIRMAVDIVRRENNVYCPCSTVRTFARNRAMQVLSDAAYSRKTTLSVIKDFAEQMITLPGKRMIVVFSDGFTLLDSTGGVRNDELQSAISRAVRSGVVIYTIDAKGLQGPPTIDAGRNTSSSSYQCPGENPPDPACYPPNPEVLTTSINNSEREKLNGLSAMAVETGGKMFENTNDLNDALSRAFDANRFYYVLSYYLPAGSDVRKFHSIKVRVRNHPEFSVRTGRGFNPADLAERSQDEAAKTPQQRLLQAIKAPLPLTDLGVSAQADFIETPADDKQVSLTVYFDGDKFQYQEQDQRNVFALEILSVIYDSSGKQVEGISAHVDGNLAQDRLTQAKSNGYRFSRRLNLKPGVYQARIGVREEGSNRMGTAATWVEVPSVTPDKLEMSSLTLRNPLDTDPGAKEGINVSELEQVRLVQGIPLYVRSDFCDYSFRVSQGTRNTAESNLVWMREVLQNGKPIKQEEWVPISEEDKAIDSKGWFDIDGDLDLSGFNPGVYELRVSVKDTPSNKTVQRTALFSVE